MSFKDFYSSKVRPDLKKELGLQNLLAIPQIEKLVINVGAGEAVTNKKMIDKIVQDLATITGQKPVVTKAKRSISAFKIRRGMPIGVKVTLRGRKMYDFLERVIKVVLPRIRDFGGISSKSIDQHGNLNLGLSEQTLFPEIDYDKIDRVRGLEMTIVTSAKDQAQGKKLLKLLGIPFLD